MRLNKVLDTAHQSIATLSVPFSSIIIAHHFSTCSPASNFSLLMSFIPVLMFMPLWVATPYALTLDATVLFLAWPFAVPLLPLVGHQAFLQQLYRLHSANPF